MGNGARKTLTVARRMAAARYRPEAQALFEYKFRCAHVRQFRGLRLRAPPFSWQAIRLH